MPRVIFSNHAILKWEQRLLGEGSHVEAAKNLLPPTRKERVAVFNWLRRGKDVKSKHDGGNMHGHKAVFVNRTADAAFLCDTSDKQVFVVVTVARLSDCLRFLKRGDES